MTATLRREHAQVRRRLRRYAPFTVPADCPPAWNVRNLTETDFQTICAARKVRLHYLPLEALGCYLEYKGLSHIFIADSISGVQRWFVEYHELGHHLLHYPGEQFAPGRKEAVEVEADAFAAIALVARPLLEQAQPKEIAKQFRYPVSLIHLRQEIAELWNL